MIRVYDLLPLILRLRDAEASGSGGIDPILQRITERLLQDETDTHAALVAAMKDLYNCLTVDNPFRTLLFQFIGQQVAEGWTESLERFLLCDAVPWHKISGTVHGWSKTMIYRVAGTYDFRELYKSEINEVGDYNPRSNSTFPYRAARVALSPAGLFPYDWSTDTITCVPPYIPGQVPPTPEPPAEPDYDVPAEPDYDVPVTPVTPEPEPDPLFKSKQKIVSPARMESFIFGQSVAMSRVVETPYEVGGDDLLIGEPNWNNPATGFFRQGRVHRYRKNLSQQWVWQESLTTPTTNPVTGMPWTDNMQVGSSVVTHGDWAWVTNQSDFAWMFKRRFNGNFALLDWTEKSTSYDIRRPVGLATHSGTAKPYAVSLYRESQPSSGVLNDSFTDADGTALTAHMTDTGHTWSASVNNATVATIYTNRIDNNPADPLHQFQGQYFISDYDATGDIEMGCVISNNSVWGVAMLIARSDTTDGTGSYLTAGLAEDKLRIVWVTPTMTQVLAEGGAEHFLNNTYAITLKIVGNVVTVSTNLETLTVSTALGAGNTKVGLNLRVLPGVSSIIDSFSVVTPSIPDQDFLQLFQENATEDGFDEAGTPIPIEDVTSISASGDYVAVGRGLTNVSGTPWVGQVDIYRVYEATPGNLDMQWVRTLSLPEQTEAIAKAIADEDTGPQFGREVHLNGKELAVTTKWPHVDVPAGGGTVRFRGAAYMYYDITGNGDFQFFQRLTRKTPASIVSGAGVSTDLVDLADSVFIGDGYVAVGSVDDHWDENFENWFDDATGSVTVFEGEYGYNGYLESQTITAFTVRGRQDADAAPEDEVMKFGFVMTGIGDTLAVGAPGDNFDANGDNEIIDGGAVYVYEKNQIIVPPDVRDVVVCQDFAILPIGGLDVTYEADDATAVLVLNDQFPPQTVTPPPTTFVGPFDLIGVRFRAWTPAGATIRINNTLAQGETHDRGVYINNMVAQEFEVWWDAADLGIPRWNDEDIDWNQFWVQFQSEGGSIYVTAAEFIVRQQPPSVGVPESGTTIYKLFRADSDGRASQAGRSQDYSTGRPMAGVWIDPFTQGLQRVGFNAWFEFIAATPDLLSTGPGVPKDARIIGSALINLSQLGSISSDQSPVPVKIKGIFNKVPTSSPIDPSTLTVAEKFWNIEQIGAVGFRDSPPLDNVIQEYVTDDRYGVNSIIIVFLLDRDPDTITGSLPTHFVEWQEGYNIPSYLEIAWETTSFIEGDPSDSCLQACECLCQTACEAACQLGSETEVCQTTCEQNCQTALETTVCQGQCQVGVEPGTSFSLPPNQDGIPCLQYELEGCFEINACLGNTIRYTDAMRILEAYFRDQRPIHVLPVYCVTTADIPEVAPCVGDDFFVRVIARFDDDANSPQFDILQIIPDCTQGCQVSCETFCEVGCEDNCQGIGPCENSCQLNCEANCQTDCEVVCQQGCVIACQNDACQSFCQSACEEVCQIACEDVCQGACEIAGCQLSCTTGCEDSCVFECQISCEFDCQSPAEIVCQTTCQEFCETCCQDQCEGVGCQTTCEQVCQASCVSGCELPCETNCQQACEAGCQSVCEFNCQADCQGAGCEVSCEGGCQGGCQGSCEVTCEGASCQLACEEEGCQSCCECQCQSDGCESDCTTGCTIRCETACETQCQAAGGCETGCEMSCEGSSEACTDCCEVCCEEYTEYGCTFGSCESTCTADNCQSACQATTQGCETICEAVACETICQTPCESICQVAGTEGCGFTEGIA